MNKLRRWSICSGVYNQFLRIIYSLGTRAFRLRIKLPALILLQWIGQCAYLLSLTNRLVWYIIKRWTSILLNWLYRGARSYKATPNSRVTSRSSCIGIEGRTRFGVIALHTAVESAVRWWTCYVLNRGETLSKATLNLLVC